jgi:hypothetical protein
MTTAIELLEKIGRALFGKDYIRKVAFLCDANPATISKWKSGKIPSFSLSHPVFPRLIWHLRNQSDRLSRMADEAESIIHGGPNGSDRTSLRTTDGARKSIANDG